MPEGPATADAVTGPSEGIATDQAFMPTWVQSALSNCEAP